MSDRIQIKRDNASIWASVNPILSDGEFGFERDTNLLKIGNGTLHWLDLPYIPLQSTLNSLTLEVRNSTGSTITRGSVVYLSGSTGNKPNITLSSAIAESSSAKTAGVVRSDIPNNTVGIIVLQGFVDSLNTNSFAEGDYLWLSTTAGAVTSTRPLPPNHAVGIGIVTKAHPTTGSIEVRIQNGFELEELHNVLINSQSSNDSLLFNATTGLWENKPSQSLFGQSGENLGGHRVVIENLGAFYYADTTNSAHINRVVGITTSAVTIGQTVNYVREGVITEPSWVWNTTLPIWLSTNGLMTQSPSNTTGFAMIVGMPISSTSMYVSLKTPILL